MSTSRSRSGARTPSERRHVGLTLPRRVKERMLDAASVLDWSAGDWVLAVAAEHGEQLRSALEGHEVRKRPAVPDATFTALYVTDDERDELDDQAVACRLNRSAFVTAVAQLGLGEQIGEVLAPLLAARSQPGDAAQPADGPTSG